MSKQKKHPAVGRKIVGVVETPWTTEEGAQWNEPGRMTLHRIRLDNGAALVFTTLEGVADYGLQMTYVKPRKP